MIAPAPAAPGETIGIVGGGQLGRMLAQAGAALGLDVRVFDPDPDAPAARVAATSVAAPYGDAAALERFAAGLRFATCEFENVPAESLERLTEFGVVVRPGAAAFRVAADRLAEKHMLQACGFGVAPFVPVAEAGSAAAAFRELGAPAILKTRRLGYDGKGQRAVGSAAAAEAAHHALGGVPCVLEQRVDFAFEFSVLAVRSTDGSTTAFDAGRNEHRDGILHRTVVPVGLDGAAEAEARNAVFRLLAQLDYVGVIAVEFFLLEGGQVLANEIAPRVHNSGHWTLDACRPDQFEAHMRAVAGWPVPPPLRLGCAEMINLIGADADSWQDWAARPHCRVHLYGKRVARPGRKMGHATRVGPREV